MSAALAAFLDRLSESYERSLHAIGIHGKIAAIALPLFVLALVLAIYSTTVRLSLLLRHVGER